MKNKDVSFLNSATQNIATYEMWCNRIEELALSVFTWEGLPNTIDERYIETTLLYNGSVVFFNDKELGYLCLPTTYSEYNLNMRPRDMTAYSVTGYTRELNEHNAVIGYGNFTRQPQISWVNHYASKLYKLDRTYDINCNSTKQPLLICCDDNEKLTFKNLYMQYDGNQPIIYGTKSLNTDNFKVLNPTNNFILDKIREEQSSVYQEMLSFFGIPTYHVKHERLVVGEIETSRIQSTANLTTALKSRENFCKRVNEMFGLKLEVRYNYE